VVYVVQEGDTLLKIASLYGVPVAAIYEANPVLSDGVLRPGLAIIIPLGARAQVTPFAPMPPPSTPEPAVQALLAELNRLVAQRRTALLNGPGWLYVHIQRTNSANCGSLLPNGAFNPCEIEEHDWYELNAQGEIVTVITRQLDPSGNVFQESVTRGGLTRNLTFGYEITAPLTTTYETDWGFVGHAAAAVARGASFTILPDSSNGMSTEHNMYHLLVEGEGQWDGLFNPQTGALQVLVTWKPAPDGLEINDSVVIVAEQRVDQPPAEVLSLLDRPLQPYQPLPPQGDPVPAGFDLAYSTLSLRTIFGDDINTPSFFYGDIYADATYLVGRVDFGSVPGGFCQRSPDGLQLAFDHVTLSNDSAAIHRLRWLELSSPADVHTVLPELQLVSLPVWGPDSARLAFTACDAAQSCGLYTYDTLSGALLRLADGGNAVPPVWSPGGVEIAFRTGLSEAPQTVVVDAASGMVIPSPGWQPQFADLKDRSILSQCEVPPALAPKLPTSPTDWLVYTNADYGFTFRYPPDWTLEVQPNFVLLKQGTLQLSIGFRQPKEQVAIRRTGVAAGDLVHGGQVSFFGQSLPRYLLVYEGKDKAVLYGMGTEIARGETVFTLSLDDFKLDYDAVNLSAELQQQVNQVIESFAWVPAGGLASSPTSTIQPTPVPPGVFAILFHPPLILNYDSSIWSDESEYTNTNRMVNYLQARSLETCHIGPQGASGNFPSPDEIVFLGNIRYQVTTFKDLPPGSTTSYYINTNSLAEYNYEGIGAIVLTISASPVEWDACKILAEKILATLQFP
jgi:hypothetical protein